MTALSGKISYGCLRLLLSQVDIIAGEEPQSTSSASDKDLWKSRNTCTVSQSLSGMRKTENVK